MVSCFSITAHEMPKFIKRWKTMSAEIRKKLGNADYEIKKVGNLYDRDVGRANKIYSLRGRLGEEELNKVLLNLETIAEMRFEYLRDNMLTEIVIPLDEIDEDLRSHFQAKTGNYSDSRVIASAIQYATKYRDTILVTTDNKDYDGLPQCLRERQKFDNYWAPKVFVIKAAN
ncbi:MAG: hypothetical protein V1676_03620 [Candidatus Diapherotrites archaeon]